MNNMNDKNFLINIQNLNRFEHFELWLKKLFYINDALQKEFDSIYQDVFYLKIYELQTEGINFAKEILQNCKENNNLKSQKWYEKLLLAIEQLMNEFSEEELDYIEYRRNESCHIFLRGYDRLKKDFTENKSRKNQDLLKVQSNIYQVINKLKNFENGNLYFNNKIHPILNQLYSELNNSR